MKQNGATPRGRGFLPRVRPTRAFADHVYKWLRARKLSVPTLCRLAFNGDDSETTYQRVQIILGGRAVPDSDVTRARLAALARATGWEEPTHEPLE